LSFGKIWCLGHHGLSQGRGKRFFKLGKGDIMFTRSASFRSALALIAAVLVVDYLPAQTVPYPNTLPTPVPRGFRGIWPTPQAVTPPNTNTGVPPPTPASIGTTTGTATGTTTAGALGALGQLGGTLIGAGGALGVGANTVGYGGLYPSIIGSS
jgi:hypothetical protein